MKGKSYNVHIVNSKQIGKQTLRDTLYQSMKVKSSHALNVNTKQLRRRTFRDT